jgi:hypothetical protein
MRSLFSILVRPPQPNPGSVRRRWEYRPRVEVLDDRLAPSVSAINTSHLALDSLVAANLAGGVSNLPTLLSILIPGVPAPLPRIVPAAQVVTPPAASTPSPLNLVGQIWAGTSPEVSLVLVNVPGQMTVTDGETLTFTAWAGYGERPADSPHFSLEPVEGADFPEGAYIEPDAGLFHWMPTAGFYTFRVRVQDGEHAAMVLVHLHVQEAAMESAWAEPTVDGAAVALPGGDDPAATLDAKALEMPSDCVPLAPSIVLAAYAISPRAVARQSTTKGDRRVPSEFFFR